MDQSECKQPFPKPTAAAAGPRDLQKPFPMPTVTAAETRGPQMSGTFPGHCCRSAPPLRRQVSVQTLKTGQEGARGAEERLGLELWMGSDGKAAANLLLTSFPAIQN